MTKPNDCFKYLTPDTVAETWDGIFSFGNLYEQLWDCVPLYDTGYRANIEDMGPHDVIGINATATFWDRFSPENQAKLNELAAAQDAEHAAWEADWAKRYGKE